MAGKKKKSTSKRAPRSKALTVFVDEIEATSSKSFLGKTGVSQRWIPKRLSLDHLHKELEQAVTQLSNLFEMRPRRSGAYEVEKITLNLGISADGKVGLLGIASGSLSTSAGIQVTLARGNPE